MSKKEKINDWANWVISEEFHPEEMSLDVCWRNMDNTPLTTQRDIEIVKYVLKKLMLDDHQETDELMEIINHNRSLNTSMW